MLADGQHAQVADGARVRVAKKASDGRDVAVLHAAPVNGRRLAGGGRGGRGRLRKHLGLRQRRDLGAERLLDQAVLASPEGLTQHLDVMVVRGAYDDGVDRWRREERRVPFVDRHTRLVQPQGRQCRERGAA